MTDAPATILAIRPLAQGYAVLTLGAPALAAEARPGQFVHVRIPSLEPSRLRRPFSIYSADPAAGHSQRYSLLIDRETGQRLDVWSLFTVPEAEARQAIAAAAGDDPDVRQRLAAAIDPERVLFYPEWVLPRMAGGRVPGRRL